MDEPSSQPPDLDQNRSQRRTKAGGTYAKAGSYDEELEGVHLAGSLSVGISFSRGIPVATETRLSMSREYSALPLMIRQIAILDMPLSRANSLLLLPVRSNHFCSGCVAICHK